MDKFELQKLRDLPIEGVAERLGLRITRHKSLCPFHDDHHASMSFKVSKNTFRCFVCGASGGTIDLVMRHLHLGFKEACLWLADEHNIILDEWKPQLPSRTGGAGGGFDASRYERFFEHPWLSPEARHFLFDERRLDERVVRWCRLTSWKDKQGVPWLQIPYYDREGKLIGIQNRNLLVSGSWTSQAAKPSAMIQGSSAQSIQAPRFRFPQGSECSIYNLPVLNLLKPGEQLYITEGCSDCWAMLSAGHKAIAIPSATLLTKKDIELLSSLPSRTGGAGGGSFHMYPDRDAPGERLFLQLQQVLPGLIHHHLPPNCKDFSEYYLCSKL